MCSGGALAERADELDELGGRAGLLTDDDVEPLVVIFHAGKAACDDDPHMGCGLLDLAHQFRTAEAWHDVIGDHDRYRPADRRAQQRKRTSP